MAQILYLKNPIKLVQRPIPTGIRSKYISILQLQPTILEYITLPIVLHFGAYKIAELIRLLNFSSSLQNPNMICTKTVQKAQNLLQTTTNNTMINNQIHHSESKINICPQIYQSHTTLTNHNKNNPSSNNKIDMSSHKFTTMPSTKLRGWAG